MVTPVLDEGHIPPLRVGGSTSLSARAEPPDDVDVTPPAQRQPISDGRSAQDWAPVSLAVARIIRRIDEVAEEIVETERREIPSYGSIHDSSILAEIKEAWERHLPRCIASIIDPTGISPNEMKAIASIGVRRLEYLPLLDLVRGIQTGIRVTLRHMLRELAEVSPSPEVYAALVLDVTARTLAMSAQVGEAIGRSYVDAEKKATTPSEPNDILGALLGPDTADKSAEHVLPPGFVPGAAHVTAVGMVDEVGGTTADPTSVLRVLTSAVREETPIEPHHCLMTRRGLEYLSVVALGDMRSSNRVVASALETASRKALAHGTARILWGIGRAEPGVGGIRTSYGQASTTLGLLRELDDGAGRLPAVMTYEDVLPYAVLLKDPVIAFEIVKASLAPLLREESSKDLIATLEAYFETGGNVSEAAKVLHVHRHTVYRRLDRIQELTNAPFAGGNNYLLLALGLKALQVLPPGARA